MTETSIDGARPEWAPVPGCRVCEHLSGTERKIVLDTDEFRAYVSEDYPWAVMLATKRHGCDGPWSLDEAEMAELGPLIGRVSSAIRRAGHDWMYVMNFGDNTPKAHYHLGFFSRWQAIPAAVQQVFRARLDDASASGMDLAVEFAAEMRSQLS